MRNTRKTQVRRKKLTCTFLVECFKQTEPVTTCAIITTVMGHGLQVNVIYRHFQLPPWYRGGCRNKGCILWYIPGLLRAGHKIPQLVTIDLLEKFNSDFPKGKLGLIWNIMLNVGQVKKLLKSGMIQGIKNLPVEEDPTRLRLLLILDRLSTHLYISESELITSLL